MKPHPFVYCRADTEEEVLSLLDAYADDAAILAGGLSLGAMLNMRIARPEVVIDVNRLEGLDRVDTSEARWVSTGALVRQADALADAALAEAVPLLARALPHVGHYQTRSRGTLGGSVAHADPSSEIPLCLATLGGEVVLASRRGTRAAAAENFFEGALSTARAGDEMITHLRWPTVADATGTAFLELSERHGDFAIVAAAAVVTRVDEALHYALGFGGVEDRPRVFRGTLGPRPTAREAAHAVVAQAAEELDPMDDPRVSSGFRAHLVRHLGASALEQAAGRLG